jgi:hypothetical protein
MAGWTGLEPATSGLTGQRSNQLNYHPLSTIKRKQIQMSAEPNEIFVLQNPLPFYLCPIAAFNGRRNRA